MATAAEKSFAKKAPAFMARFMRDFPQVDLLGTAAVFGNAGGESAGLTTLQEGNPTVKGSKGGWGWFQWTGPRRRAFEAWCAAKGLAVNSDEANYSFLVHELQVAELKAIPALLKAKTLDEKTVAFEKAYERAGIKHYPERKAWALKALHAYEAVYGAASPAVASTPLPGGITLSPVPIALPEKQSWGSWFKRAVGIPSISTPVAPVTPGDPIIYNIQAQLISKGYTELGEHDGLAGGKLYAAAANFRADNGLPKVQEGEEIDADFRAALPGAAHRPVGERGQATVKTLEGNPLTQQFGGVLKIGALLAGFAGTGAADQGGLFQSIKETVETAQGIVTSVQSAIVTTVGIVQWLYHHWWLVLLAFAAWIMVKAVAGRALTVIMYRLGNIQRASI